MQVSLLVDCEASMVLCRWPFASTSCVLPLSPPETLNGRLLQLMEPTVERWKQNDAGTARINDSDSGSLEIKGISLIESAELPAYNLAAAAMDWEGEVYF
ncbi:MAG: hypothetical protein K2X77_09115 [Candidatus Obscuribacterales bacterium]|nr:hypothetical protein [Candidatus Obscuribacterales bacterium]